MIPFTWLPGIQPPAAQAVALAALRPGAKRTPYTLTMGPLRRPDGAPWSGVSIELGLYAAPHDAEPLHGMLRGLAREVTAGTFARGFLLPDLVAHLAPRAGQTVYGCADGPGFRVAVPIRVVPDAARVIP